MLFNWSRCIPYTFCPFQLSTSLFTFQSFIHMDNTRKTTRTTAKFFGLFSEALALSRLSFTTPFNTFLRHITILFFSRRVARHMCFTTTFPGQFSRRSSSKQGPNPHPLTCAAHCPLPTLRKAPPHQLQARTLLI